MFNSRLAARVSDAATAGVALIASVELPPGALYALASLHLLPMPAADRPRAFLMIGILNFIFVSPVFITIYFFVRWKFNAILYIVTGLLASLPATFILTMAFSALADQAELAGRLFVLATTPVLGSISGGIFAWLTRRRFPGKSV